MFLKLSAEIFGLGAAFIGTTVWCMRGAYAQVNLLCNIFEILGKYKRRFGNQKPAMYSRNY